MCCAYKPCFNVSDFAYLHGRNCIHRMACQREILGRSFFRRSISKVGVQAKEAEHITAEGLATGGRAYSASGSRHR